MQAQTLESLGVPASAFLIPQGMPEAPQGQAWLPQHQGFNPALQQGHMDPTASPNHIFVMNSVKPEQQIPQRRPEEVINSPSVTTPSVITATYNPTYNRCLPKILSDLDCEMKIKQVLRCIETILLENGDVDLQQQAYKLPDRSLSPQFSKTTKKPKLKEDEEMVQAPSPAMAPPISLPLATNSPSSLIKAANNNKNNNIKINVKVEPEAGKEVGGPTTPRMQAVFNEQAVPNGSPRGQMFDFPMKHQQQQVQQSPQQPPQFPRSPAVNGQAHLSPQRSFSYESYTNSPQQPMIPHVQLPGGQLSMSTPHMNNHGATNSPHLQSPHALHNSTPHLHNSHTNSPQIQQGHAHSPLHHTHTNSPHLQTPHTLSPHAQHSPHGPALSPQAIPIQQFQVLTPLPNGQDAHNIPEFTYQTFLEGVQEASGFKAHEAEPHKKENPQQAHAHHAHAHTPQQQSPAAPGGQQQQPHTQQAQQPIDPMSFLYDPTLVAQYLAQNQQQLQALQAQLHAQQQQYAQLHGGAGAAGGAGGNPLAAGSTGMPLPFPLADLANHPINLSGHLLVPQIGPDGGISLQEDDKWILSLLNMDSSLVHDLSLSGQIPPPL